MLKASKLWMPGLQESIFQHLLEPEAGPEGGNRNGQEPFGRPQTADLRFFKVIFNDRPFLECWFFCQTTKCQNHGAADQVSESSRVVQNAEK